RWASVTFYLVLSWRFLKTLNHKRGDEFKRVQWLKQFVTVFLWFQVVWLCHLVPYVIPSLRSPLLDSVGWFPVYIPLTALIYYFGIKGILVSNSSRLTSNLVDKLSPERINFVLARLKQAMTNDKLYLEPSLTVGSVSKHLKIPAKEISSVLNQVEARSFNEFVNYYRVQDFKKKVYDSRLKFLTISGIALECGFNSQATFQRTFKQLEGMSPTEYFNLHGSEARISA
ncbi:MAG TPA: helix-turn-helix domain-containing protein, partial [Chryseosolibacter sp.]